MASRVRRVCVIGVMMALAGHGAQAEVTADQAAGLERDLHGWILGLLSPLVDDTQIPLRITPAGDRYRMEIGPVTVPGVTVTSDGVTGGFLRTPGEGRWVVEEFTLPRHVEVTAGDDRTSVYSVTIGQQRARMEIDPTLATASRLEAEYGKIEQTSRTARGSGVTHTARVILGSVWQPGAGGRMNATSEMRLSGYERRETMQDGSVATLKAREITATSRGEGVSPERFGAALRMVAQLVGNVRASADGGDPPTREQRTMMHAVLDRMVDLFTRVESDQTWSGVSLAAEGMTGSLERFSLGNAVGAPGGKTEFGLRLELAGFESPMLPKGGIRDLVPRRVSVAPRVSGFNKADVVTLLAHGIDMAGNDDADMMGEAMQLLAGSPAVISIDSLDVDLGGSRLRGSGQVSVASPDDVTGRGELRMTGLDALLRNVGKVPEAAMAAPVLLMLKGLGQQSGAETVWRITYAANKVMVNGQDLSAMLGRAK